MILRILPMKGEIRMKIYKNDIATVVMTKKEVALKTNQMEYIYRPRDKRELPKLFRECVEMAKNPE